MLPGLKKKLSALAVLSLASLTLFVLLKGRDNPNLYSSQRQTLVERVDLSHPLKRSRNGVNIRYDDVIKHNPHKQFGNAKRNNAKPRQRGRFANEDIETTTAASDTSETTTIDVVALKDAVDELKAMVHRKRPEYEDAEGNKLDGSSVTTTDASQSDTEILPETVEFDMPPGNAARKYQYWLSNDTHYDLPYNVSVVKQQQEERKQLIQQTCQLPDIKSQIHKPSESHRSNFVSHKHIMYCPILKAGSTNMLRLMCWLRGPPCSNIKHLMPHNMVPKYLGKGTKIARENSPRFLNYFSFAIVRNPWRRLVSVYIQKFVETRQGIGFCGLKTRMPDLYKYYRKHRNVTMSFKNYIDICVIGQHDEGGIFNQNGHWRPQYQMCSFCDLDFTFIGKIETMKSDERVILNTFGFKDVDQAIADSNSHLLPNEKAGKTKLLYEDLWKEIEEYKLKLLRGIYDVDIKMFDYPKRPLP